MAQGPRIARGLQVSKTRVLLVKLSLIKLVERAGYAPAYPKDRVYSAAVLTNSPTSPVEGLRRIELLFTGRKPVILTIG